MLLEILKIFKPQSEKPAINTDCKIVSMENSFELGVTYTRMFQSACSACRKLYYYYMAMPSKSWADMSFKELTHCRPLSSLLHSERGRPQLPGSLQTRVG